jgi:hypothetical protein
MSWLAALPIVGDIIKGAENILDQYVLDKDKALEGKLRLKQLELEYQLKLQNMEHEQVIAQQEVNKVEAASPDKYVSRARPTSLWICNLALFYSFLGYPFLQWYCVMFAPLIVPPPLPNVDYLFVLLGALLGVGGMRSFDKWQEGKQAPDCFPPAKR